MGKTARKAIGIAMAAVIFGVLLLCIAHAVVQLVTGSPLDAGDWIGLATLAIFVIGFRHLRSPGGSPAPPE